MTLATSNSPSRDSGARGARTFLSALLLLGSLTGFRALAVEGPFAGLAQKTFTEATTRYRAAPNNAEAGWHYARACFDLAEFATNSTERAELAQLGIAASRRLIQTHPALVQAHYYLAMNLGQLARTKGIGALKLVSEMEREFLAARDLDERFDFAGPHRNLGLLYRDAPSIASVGSRSKAKKHLTRAVELAPEYPDNRLSLIEAFQKWSDRNGVVREWKALEAQWPAAKDQFKGPQWQASWADWQPRYNKIKAKLADKSTSLETPRH